MTTIGDDDRAAIRELCSDLAPGEMIPMPAAVGDAVPSGCLLDVFGIRGTHLGKGSARGAMTVRDLHLNQRGVVQGGCLAAFADAIAGWAVLPVLPEKKYFTTLVMTTNLLGTSRAGDELLATAAPVHLGRTTMVIDVSVDRLLDQGGSRRIASFSCTQLVMEIND